MCEFRKLLHHLNRRIATPICWFTLMNLIYTLSATIFAFRHLNSWSDVPWQTVGLTLGNVVLWLLLGLFPFFQVCFFLIYNVWNVFNQKSPGRLLNIGVSACPDVWTRDSHSPLRSSQYVCRGPKFGATLFVITANVRQIVSHAHSVQLPVLCNSVFNCYRSYFWHVP